MLLLINPTTTGRIITVTIAGAAHDLVKTDRLPSIAIASITLVIIPTSAFNKLSISCPAFSP